MGLRRHRALIVVVAASAVFFMASCSGFKHGYTLSDFEGQVVPARKGRGADRLQIEADFDATIKGVLQTQGTPDYILVESSDAVKLIYITDDRVISFQRGWGTTSTASVQNGIPAHLAAFFTAPDRHRLAEVRGEPSGRVLPVAVEPTLGEVRNEQKHEDAVPTLAPTRTRTHAREAVAASTTAPPTLAKTPTVPRPTATTRPPKATPTPKAPACVDTTAWSSALTIADSSWSMDTEFLPIAEWTVKVRNASCSTTFKDINFQTRYSAPSGTVVDESFFGHTEFITIKPGQTVTVRWTETTHSQAVRASVHIESAKVW